MYAAINGMRMHYLAEGDGPPLVIPSMAGTQICERTFSRNLRQQLQLVFVELRAGRSNTGVVTDQTPAAAVDDLDSVRQHSGHERAAVLGYSNIRFIALTLLRCWATQVGNR
jgi:pimeloyl-ACP methyl ester carboxylesterase